MGNLQSQANTDSLSVHSPYSRQLNTSWIMEDDDLGDDLYAQMPRGEQFYPQHDIRTSYKSNKHQRDRNMQTDLNGYLPSYHHHKDYSDEQHLMTGRSNFMDKSNAYDRRPTRPTSLFTEESHYFNRPHRRRSPAYEREFASQKVLYKKSSRRELGEMVFVPDVRKSQPETKREKRKAHSNPRHFSEYHHEEENEEDLTINPPQRLAYMEELTSRLQNSNVSPRPPKRRSPSKPRRNRDQPDETVHYSLNERRQRKVDHRINDYVEPKEHRYYDNSQYFRQRVPSEARSTARRQHHEIPTSFNIGVTGGRGAGKSDLIDAIRGIQRDELSSARVPQTRSIHPFFFDDPSSEHIVLVEIPYPKRQTFTSYFRAQQLSQKLQYLLIVIDGSLREDDINCAIVAHGANIPIAFIFSKCDIDLRSAADELSLLTPTEQCRLYRENGRKYFESELRRCAPELRRCPAFFVSVPVIREMWQTSQNHPYAKMPEFVLDERAALDYFLEIVSNVKQSSTFGLNH